MKRKLALVTLCLLLVLSAMPASIFAAEYTIKDDIKNSGSLQIENYDGSGEVSWERKYGEGGWTAVDSVKTLPSGRKLPVIASDGSLNVVYDNFGTALREGSEVYYRATVNGVETSEFKVPYYNQVQNGSFENPTIDYVRGNDNKYCCNYDGSDFMQIPNGYSGLVWKTTVECEHYNYKRKAVPEGYYIEIVKGASADGAYGITGAADGEQFAELNCEAIGALYQDVLTTPGADLYWQLYHRARAKGGSGDTNTMYVVVMSTELAETGNDGKPIDTMEKVDEAIKRGEKGIGKWEVTSDSKAWHMYTNNSFNNESRPYKVPEGQYLTRFFFVSANANAGSRTEGNLLDNISFSETLPGKGSVAVTKKVEGLTAEEIGDDYTVEVTLYSQGEEVVASKTIAVDSAAMEGSETFANLEPGSYTLSETQTVEKDGYTLTTTYSAQSITVNVDATQYVTVTNKYEKTSQNITVKKVWRTPAGSEAAIPEQIGLQLYKNGSPEGDEVILTSENENQNGEWEYTWENLPVKDEGGSVIIYTVAETSIDGNALVNNSYTIKGTDVVSGQEVETVKGVWSASVTGFTITNTYRNGKEITNEDQGSGEFTVKKVDDQNQPLTGAEFTLEKGGESYPVNKNAAGTEFKFSNLPAGTYELKESTTPFGYTNGGVSSWTVKVSDSKEEGASVVSVTPKQGEENAFVTLWKYIVSVINGEGGDNLLDEDGVLTVKNYKLTTFTAEKKWELGGAAQPQSVTLQLYAKGEKVGNAATVTASESWTHEWTELLKYDESGNEIVYTVEETAIDGEPLTDGKLEVKAPNGTVIGTWESKVDENVVTNTYTAESISLEVEKVWAGVPEGTSHPDSVSVRVVYFDKETQKEVTAATAELNAEGGWKKVFEGLAKYNANGDEIIYSVVETPVEGYQLSNEKAAGKVTLTNTYVKTLRIEKIAVGFDSTDEFNFTITAVDSQNNPIDFSYEKGTIGEDASLGDYTTSPLDITLSNNEYVELKLPLGASYTVTEASVDGVKTYVDGELKNSAAGVMANEDKTIRFLNWKPEKTQVTATKVWNDGSDRDQKRPLSVTLQLYANGEPVSGKSVAVGFDAQGNPLDGTVKVDDNTWSYTFADLQKNTDSTETTPIVYTVKEVGDIGEYSSAYSDDRLTVTNSYTPEAVSKTVVKLWDDMDDLDEVRPQNVVVQLYADGEEVEGEEVELNSECGWSYTWENLPANANGKKITYTVRETSESLEYETMYSEDTFTITNMHIPTRDVVVKKTISGNKASERDEFSFKITFTDEEGIPVDWIFAYTKGDEIAEYGSEYEFSLKGGESLVVRDVPVGMNYKVEETDSKGYVSTSANAEGKVTSEGATAEFVNTRNDIPKTGDSGTLGIYLAIFALSVVAMLATLCIKKKIKMMR